MLKAGAGYEYEEIAELVATEVGTVKFRSQKAMRRLVELLEVHNDSVVPIHAFLPHGNASESNPELLHPDRVCTNNLDNLIEYAHEKNISRYKLLLLETTDEKRRRILLELLSEEEAKMGAMESQAPETRVSILEQNGQCTSPTWPVSGSELASLIDLGLSDDLIAKYFGVELRKVTALRSYFGLINGHAPAKNDDGTAPTGGG